jgi:hypothetical protein
LPTLFTEGTSANWRTLPVLEEASIDALSFYVSLELLVHIFPRKKRINMLQLESKYMSVENELGPFMPSLSLDMRGLKFVITGLGINT